jgi:hypothetical protein
MSIGVLRTDEQWACKAVLIRYSDVIRAAYRGSLGLGHEPEVKRKINAVIGLGVVLNTDRTLCTPFRTVMTEVLQGRDPNALAGDDWGKIATRSPEWLGADRLNAAWRI